MVYYVGGTKSVTTTTTTTTTAAAAAAAMKVISPISGGMSSVAGSLSGSISNNHNSSSSSSSCAGIPHLRMNILDAKYEKRRKQQQDLERIKVVVTLVTIGLVILSLFGLWNYIESDVRTAGRGRGEILQSIKSPIPKSIHDIHRVKNQNDFHHPNEHTQLRRNENNAASGVGGAPPYRSEPQPLKESAIDKDIEELKHLQEELKENRSEFKKELLEDFETGNIPLPV